MNRGLRIKLLKRLFLVSVVMAALSGFFVYLLEMQRVNEQVVSLALEESHGLMEHISFLSARDKEDYDRVRDQAAQHILAEHVIKGHFITIELYDRGKIKVLEVTDPEFDSVDQEIDRKKHDVMPGEAVDYQKFYMRSALYVDIFAPLKLASDETVAYFEGIYRIDAHALNDIYRRLLLTVLLVIVIVFFTTIALYPVIIRLNRDTVRLSDDLTSANMGMLEVLGSAVAKRDRGTNDHNYRVTLYAIRLAEAVGLGSERITGLIKGAFLHDVGKIGIADAILLKPAGLDEQEIRIMAIHVQHGVDIIGKYTWLRDALDVIRYHHEKYDGTGYLSGIAGRNIPLAARIFAVVDVFDALTTKRPYRDPATLETTLQIMREDRGRAFDPSVLDVFLGMAPDLYRDVCLAGEKDLERSLDGYLKKYFLQA